MQRRPAERNAPSGAYAGRKGRGDTLGQMAEAQWSGDEAQVERAERQAENEDEAELDVQRALEDASPPTFVLGSGFIVAAPRDRSWEN